MKKAFLISGFSLNRTTADAKYAELRKAIASKGYQVVTVPITWNYKSVAQYAELFKNFYNQNKANVNIVIGNSFGAMVTFVTAPVLKPNKILVCSLSPYFNEDRDKTTREYRLKRFGKQRETAMNQLSAKQTAQELNGTEVIVTLLYGEQEKQLYPHLVERVRATAKDLKKCRLVEIPNAPHNFADPFYIRAIIKEL